MEDTPTQSEKNFELLIRIDEKQKFFNEQLLNVHTDLTLIKNDFTNRLNQMERNKMDKSEANSIMTAANQIRDDHEVRLRRLERYGGLALGGIYVLYAISAILLGLFKH